MNLLERIQSSDLFARTLSKWQLKLIFSFVAFAIVLSVIWFSQMLVDELIRREQRIINLYAGIYELYSNPTVELNDWFLLDRITPTITFPMISTKANDEPNYPFEQYTLNVELDTTLSVSEQRERLNNMIEKMGNTYPPIIVRDTEGKILTKFYYYHSSLIDKLRYFPYIAIFAIAAFIAVGYIAFSNIRRNEESKVWVGMAKEAAHQLGTPLSSLLAWLEILKLSKDSPESIAESIPEMEKDITRLSSIATRFSKIGSMPAKKVENVATLIEKVCQYSERRLPNIGKKIEIVRDLDYLLKAEVNDDLFEWVIENLIKNAAEAIDNKEGSIIINMELRQRRKIYISVRDTGKGMTARQRRQVFSPGFTTKRRGWGLGLSLSKRIIEEYHDGRIYIKESSVNKGTEFVIELPAHVSSLTHRAIV
jgi:two-component sensor histidine kinase